MDFDLAVITDHWQFLAYGIGITLVLSLVSGMTSLAAGFCLALLRLYAPRWLRVIVVFYIDSMRAIPVLVVLVWTFFALPMATGLTMSPFYAALIGLTLHLAAYAAEIVRAGIESVRAGQTRASLALGMSRRADPAPHRAAAGARAHAAGVRIAAVGHDQGHGHRLRDRRARTHAAIRDRWPARASGRSRSTRSPCSCISSSCSR